MRLCPICALFWQQNKWRQSSTERGLAASGQDDPEVLLTLAEAIRLYVEALLATWLSPAVRWFFVSRVEAFKV